MKVVLFCGGQGVRMHGAAAEGVPKPLAPLGRRTLLWHVMRYYAHWGHRDFILCLGQGGEAIKEHFVAGEDWRSSDFTLVPGADSGPELLNRDDMRDWRITFVDTGADATVAERLLAVRPLLRGEDTFLANHADVLSDHPLPQLVEDAWDRRAVAAFLAARPNPGLRVVEQDEEGAVRAIRPVEETPLRVNGGFFVFDRDIFDHIRPGEDLEDGTFARLAEQRLLFAHRHDGFWRSCDTPKDLRALEGMTARGPAPWELWRRFPHGDGPPDRDWLGPQLRQQRSTAAPEALGR